MATVVATGRRGGGHSGGHVVATGWPRGDAVVATWWPRGGHGGTGAGSLIGPALSVSPPSEWRYGGMGVALVALSETKRHSRNPHGVRVSGVSGVSGVWV